MNTRLYYELPLNERIRVFIRLEQLFLQFDYFLSNNTIWDRRATINTLLDIMIIFNRHNLKSEILKELDRQASALHQIADNQGVDSSKLNQILNALSKVSKSLYQSKDRVSDLVMDNELLRSISQRSAMPGGAFCSDLPAYQFWLEQDKKNQLKDIQQWLQPFATTRTAIDLILKFIRQSRVPSEEIAQAGFFQLTLNKSLSYELIRIKMAKNIPCFVEISGGKHRFTARFMNPSSHGGRPLQTADNIPFEIACCLY